MSKFNLSLKRTVQKRTSLLTLLKEPNILSNKILDMPISSRNFNQDLPINMEVWRAKLILPNLPKEISESSFCSKKITGSIIRFWKSDNTWKELKSISESYKQSINKDLTVNPNLSLRHKLISFRSKIIAWISL